MESKNHNYTGRDINGQSPVAHLGGASAEPIRYKPNPLRLRRAITLSVILVSIFSFHYFGLKDHNQGENPERPRVVVEETQRISTEHYTLNR